MRGHEGLAFEKMIKLLLEECSRKSVGDFSLTHLAKGYWNRTDGSDIEIDVVAIDEDSQIIRVGSCKRAASGHDGASLSKFEEHISKFIGTVLGRRYSAWKVQKALYSPLFDERSRQDLTRKGYMCFDLLQFQSWLLHPSMALGTRGAS